MATADGLGSRDITRRRGSRSGNTRDSRTHRTFSNFATKMKSLFLGYDLAQPVDPIIPAGLSAEGREVYQTLDRVVKMRHTNGQKPQHLVVITDLAKDYDDLAAMVVLKELHRLGLVVLEGFIANLKPAEDRAQFGRGALDSMGLENIPIAIGSDGTDNPHNPFDYEFKICDFMADKRTRKVTEEGQELLLRLYQQAKNNNQKLKVVLLSSLRDIAMFVEKEPTLFKNVTSEVVLQGGCLFSSEGILEPDPDATNNNFDIIAARNFHHFLQQAEIRSTSYTKVATFATPITTGLFVELAKDGHIIGQHLRKVQALQDFQFYSQATEEDPLKRFRAWMDAEWYLEHKTDWFDSHTKADPYPRGDEVIPYLTKVIAYDALPAVGSAGDDALEALKILLPSSDSSNNRVIGVKPKDGPEDPGVNGKRMSLVICTLLKGSLLASLQNLPAV